MKSKWQPMFKFGAPRDTITQFNINEHVYVKVFKSLIECVCLKGTIQDDLTLLAWLLLHCKGHLFVNLPTPTEPKKLFHIHNLQPTNKVQNVTVLLSSHVNKISTHFVLQCQFQTYNSIFNSEIINKHDLARIYHKLSTEMMELQTC